MPVIIHVSRRPAGEPVSRAISAATMKMPEPIIDPSKSPMARTNPVSLFAAVSGTEMEASAIRLARPRRRIFYRAQNVNILARALRRVARAQNIADYDHA